MFRKIVLALSATAALAAAALAPTAASAWGHGRHNGWHGGYGVGFGFYGPSYIAASPDCYRVRRVVDTAYGPRVRRVLVCN